MCGMSSPGLRSVRYATNVVQSASGLRDVSGERYATPAARLLRNTMRSFCDIRVFRVNIEVTRPRPV